jgi:NAD(P)-dependent dehydrogenase (short-subunit alcohol dehydrogenase family)
VPGALVTGAGRGLGLEIARGLAARGLAVHVTDIDGEAARRAAEELGPGCFASRLDVRDEEACRSVAALTVSRAGSLDVWVNNAGILVTGHVWEHEPGIRRTVFEVNALGTINGTLAALEPMRTAGFGHVINIVSLAGLAAAPGEALYAATKHAAIAFSIAALADLRRAGYERIHVSAVCPDGIWTPMIADRLDDPHAAPSFSRRLLSSPSVAAKVVRLVDRPRPVLAIPRWRGAYVRLLAAFPALTTRMIRIWMADARRRQRRWKRRVEAGRLP